jgi:hypothetical protein
LAWAARVENWTKATVASRRIEGCIVRLTRYPLIGRRLSFYGDVSLEETPSAALGQLLKGLFARMRRSSYVLRPCAP